MPLRRVDIDKLRHARTRLGEAALDPASWPEILQEICTAARAKGAALLQSDVRTLDVPRSKAAPETFDLYFAEGWHKRDLRAERGVPLLLRGAPVIIDQDMVTAEEMKTQPFYREFLGRTDMQYGAVIGFRAGSALWGLALQGLRRDGPFEADDKRLLAEIAPSLTEVATLSTAVGRIALTGIMNALETLHKPAIALDRRGCVAGTNSSAEKILDDNFHIENGRVFIRDVASRVYYDKFLEKLRAATDYTILSVEPIHVRRGTRLPLLIRALPIAPATRGPFLDARVLLAISDPGINAGPSIPDLKRMFGLSYSEARIAIKIASGLSIQDVAAELAIAEQTARNQLKVVFAKTGTHRQGALIALLSRF